MLPLDELKTALTHDSARRWPEVAKLPDYAAARSLLRDAMSVTMEAGDWMFLTPKDLSSVRTKIDEAISKLQAARSALDTKEGGTP